MFFTPLKKLTKLHVGHFPIKIYAEYAFICVLIFLNALLLFCYSVGSMRNGLSITWVIQFLSSQETLTRGRSRDPRFGHWFSREQIVTTAAGEQNRRRAALESTLWGWESMTPVAVMYTSLPQDGNGRVWLAQLFIFCTKTWGERGEEEMLWGDGRRNVWLLQHNIWK